VTAVLARGLAGVSPLDVVTRVLAAAGLAVSGYIHTDLYENHGYHFIPRIGLAFQWQAAASFAVAVLLPLTRLVLLRLAAAGLAAASLGAFTMSRTVGVLGFTEHGWTPAPQALVSVLAEISVLVVLAVPFVRWLIRTDLKSLIP
jgi:hypothetical protein